MKILNMLIVLCLCYYISAKSIVPKSTAQKHKKFMKRQRKAQSSNAVNCYENCRKQQQLESQGHGNRISAGQKEVYSNTMNRPEDNEQNWQPNTKILRPLFGLTRDVLKTGTMLTADVIGSQMQMKNDLYQAQSRVEYNKQMQEHQLEAQKLQNDALLQEEQIHQNDQIYKEQQSSPYYQEQAAQMQGNSPSFKIV